MTHSKLRKLKIDQTLFRIAFDRDVNATPYPQIWYLNVENGEFLLMYENEKYAGCEVGIPAEEVCISAEENRVIREIIQASPSRYLLIPGLQHEDHHKILQEFLNSGWTDDKEVWNNAQKAYSGHIRRWIDSVPDEVAYTFYDFREGKTEKMAEKFLREHGIEPKWK
jgi:hypothetical protein